MSTNATSFASYATSVALFLKGLCVSAAQAFAGMPTEGKIGALLGLGTFLVNSYFQYRRTAILERQQGSGHAD